MPYSFSNDVIDLYYHETRSRIYKSNIKICWSIVQTDTNAMLQFQYYQGRFINANVYLPIIMD